MLAAQSRRRNSARSRYALVTVSCHADEIPEETPEESDVALPPPDPFAPGLRYDCVLLHGSRQDLVDVQQKLARRPGPVIIVERLEPGDTTVPVERLVVERSLSINTAAAGGNASLMAIS